MAEPFLVVHHFVYKAWCIDEGPSKSRAQLDDAERPKRERRRAVSVAPHWHMHCIHGAA
jgi:hypothetical protein